jgi:folylpolyglutamate synthase/dihydropteroate synthase
LKLNGTHQLSVYTDDVSILGGSIHTIKKNKGGLLVSSKVTGLGVNSDKTKYTVMSQNRNAKQSHDTETENNSFERAEEFKILGNSCNKSKF